MRPKATGSARTAGERRWGESGWFKIGYGESGFGTNFAFYAVQFTADDDLVMPKEGSVIIRLKSKNTTLDDEIRLHYPEDELIFRAQDSEIGS